ncbi:MAG: (5-formylfuran-3-yl)methyl phosphate synthase [Methanosarcinales archaeon Met12]|nr:MAG: (5-formylfuran-3-yl)methyl phosphate synthase [Methanosarcinales archaeon Met12]
MKLLISPIDIEEAKDAEAGGADIIDVKNPKEGSLGANFPWVISAVKKVVSKPLSATIGDFGFKPGTASLSALGAAVAGADFIKIGLFDISTKEQALTLLQNVKKAVKDYDSSKKVVAAAYADFERLNTLSPFDLPDVGQKAGIDIVMIDTGIKDGRGIFDFLSKGQVAEFTSSAKEVGLGTALAGSLGWGDIKTIHRISPDIIGIRGLVCGGDRNRRIQQKEVERLKKMICSI